MRIGINTLYVVPGGVGGAEYYLTNLLNGLHRVDGDNRYVLFVSRDNQGLFAFPSENFKKILLPFSNRNRKLRVLFEQLVIPRLCRRESLDLLHCPNNMAPVIKTCGLVLTIQSLHCFMHREYLPRLKMGYIRNQLKVSARMAEHVITPSQSARDDAVRLLGVPRDRVTSILDYVSIPTLFPEGIRIDEQVLAKYGVKSPFLFSPSSMYPYKNITAMLLALRDLRQRHGLPHTLVVAGRDDIGYYPMTRQLAEQLGVGDAFLYLRQVPHQEVPTFYRYADLTLFPSYCETFGIPVLESMAIGTPVVCSNRSSLPEVVGDAAVQVDPDRPEEMTREVLRLVRNPEHREALRVRGLERAAEFDCERAARETILIYEKVCRSRGGKRRYPARDCIP